MKPMSPSDIANFLPSVRAKRLNLGTLNAISVLAGTQETRICDLASKLNITPTAATGLVDRLENLGYARRKDDPANRRQILVSLTRRGTAAVRDLFPGHKPRTTTTA